MLGTTFTEAGQRATAFGTWGAVAAGGGAVGALIGGVITEFLSWRWILLVNVPIGALLCAGVLYAVTESRRDDAERRVDVLGSLSITISLVALVYAVVQAQKLGWSDPRTLTTLGVSVVLLVLFIINEGKLAKQPLVPLTMFRSRSVSAANIVAFTSTAALWGTFYLFTPAATAGAGLQPATDGAGLPAAVAGNSGRRARNRPPGAQAGRAQCLLADYCSARLAWRGCRTHRWMPVSGAICSARRLCWVSGGA